MQGGKEKGYTSAIFLFNPFHLPALNWTELDRGVVPGLSRFDADLMETKSCIKILMTLYCHANQSKK